MPRNQGTSRKGKPKKDMRSAGFGKALQRSQTKRHAPKSNGSSAHGQGMMATGAQTIGVSEPTEGTKMKSVLEIDDLSDFLMQAQLANKDFQSERERFLDLENFATEYVPTGMASATIIHEEAGSPHARRNFSFRELCVPRRPAWTPGVTTPEELEAMENESFLEWRRGLARNEERIAALASTALHNGSQPGGGAGASITPYEKNLQVWRQLWRVLERSSVVLQIVDARNPLFYLSDDLRRYAGEELGKPTLVLVNKSDYLTLRQRERWSEYFGARGVDHLFFSAYEEQRKIDEAVATVKRGRALGEEGPFSGWRVEREKAAESDDDEKNLGDDGDDGASWKSAADGGVTGSAEISLEPPVEEVGERAHRTSGDSLSLSGSGILSREQLLDTLNAFATRRGCALNPKYDDRIQYGMVGFPNVGKSSVINVLVGSSRSLHGVARAGVASQPGKTKHFQTLLIPDRDDMMLCDCPGLVFPSFVSSAADMVAAGVYPIAQMRDHWPVVELICGRVPRDVLNAHFGIHIPEPSEHELREQGWTSKTLPPPSAQELLATYCVARSVLAPVSGVPDYQRAARVVVRDYSEGKLLYCHAPPASEGDGRPVEAEEEYQRETLRTAVQNTTNARKLRRLEQSLEETVAVAEGGDSVLDEGGEFDEFDSILGDIKEECRPNKGGDRRGKSHKTIKKWGKKGRKLRNRDPYGCHSNPDIVLQSSSMGKGVIVNAGKYSGSYTRANYVGAKAATPFDGHCSGIRARKTWR